MRLDEVNTMVSKSLLYHFKHGSFHRKTVSLKNAVFDLSWPLTPKPIGVGTLFKLGANFWYKDCHFSRRAPYNYLSAAQLKEIDRLRCFVINFDIAVFHPLFRNVNNFSKSTTGLWANGITHFPTAMSVLSWRKCEKTYRYAMVSRIFARLSRCRKHPLCSAGDRFQK